MQTVEIDIEWAVRELYDSWQPRTYYYPNAELEAVDLHAKIAAVRERYFRKLHLRSSKWSCLNATDDSEPMTSPYGVDLSGFPNYERFIEQQQNARQNVATANMQMQMEEEDDEGLHSPPVTDGPVLCVFCDSENTKFDCYNNKEKSQPRYRCKNCRRRFTQGGKLRPSRELLRKQIQERGRFLAMERGADGEMTADEIAKLISEMMRQQPEAAGAGGGGIPAEFNKAHLVRLHDAASRSMQSMPAGLYKSYLNVSLPGDTSSVGDVASLARYTPILLKDMAVGKVHRGRVLYGELVAAPFAMSSLMTVLEDHAGYAMRLTVCVGDAVGLNDFPLGCKVAIKEPYLKIAMDGNLGIRVDDPGRIIRIDDIGELVSLRLQGNASYARQKWDEAIQGYTRCIARCLEVRESKTLPQERIHEVLLPALSNRAEAYMKLKDYDRALFDCNAALAIDKAHLKSVYRKGRALLGLEKFGAAADWLQRALDMDPLGSAEIVEALEAARAGLKHEQVE